MNIFVHSVTPTQDFPDGEVFIGVRSDGQMFVGKSRGEVKSYEKCSCTLSRRCGMHAMQDELTRGIR